MKNKGNNEIKHTAHSSYRCVSKDDLLIIASALSKQSLNERAKVGRFVSHRGLGLVCK